MLHHRIGFSVCVAALVLTSATGVTAAPVSPPEVPAEISIEVAPEAVSPGDEAQVTLRLVPIEGIKIARYPQIKLKVAAQEGIVDEASVAIGSKAPPPPDKLDTNYWKDVDPVVLTLSVDEAATSGSHEVEAKLTYYYCVAGNFCAPKRVPLKIPLAVQ